MYIFILMVVFINKYIIILIDNLILLSIFFVIILEFINSNNFIGYKEVLSSGTFSSMKIDYGFKKFIDGNFCVTGILVFTTVYEKRKYTNCFAENIESLRNVFYKINSSKNKDN